VVIADDHPMIRRGLASLLATERDIVVVGEAADGEEAVSVARTTCPHVVVMDVVMDGVDGIEGTRRLRAEMPGVAVLGLSMHELGGEMDHAMHRAGAVGFIAKGSPPEDLAAAIRACLATVEA
jgi:DNA-binding NarL/FixJ family response regulator